MIYRVELTEEQARVVQYALEEYFRLRLSQCSEFAIDMAETGRDEEMAPDNPNRDLAFEKYLVRRDAIEEMMKAVFKTAFSPTGYLNSKTNDMMIAECVWDALRFARGQSRWAYPFQIGPEPVPKVEKKES